MMDPQLGRFIQLDPIGTEGIEPNLYRTESDSPINRLDPSGLKDMPPLSSDYPIRVKFEGDFSEDELRLTRQAMLDAAERIRRALYVIKNHWKEVQERFRYREVRRQIMVDGKMVEIIGHDETTFWKFLNSNDAYYIQYFEKILEGLKSSKGRYIRCLKTNETHSDGNPMYTDEWRALWIDWSQRTIVLRIHFWDLSATEGYSKAYWTAHEFARFFLQMDNNHEGLVWDVNGVQSFDEVLDKLEDLYVKIQNRKNK
ncbi:MAG TPA: hypothetical protein VKS79_15240 [Gemmataceae bacterium]|nr:hypothetical protein [Gemmataceae bacterium]